MDSPISASFRAGASLVPSPVTATTWPFSFKHCTIKSLSNGDDRAITRIASILVILSSAVLTPGLHGSFSPMSANKIVVADPMVSQAESFLTIALSFIILLIE